MPLAAGTATVSVTRPLPSLAGDATGAAARVGATATPDATSVPVRDTSTRSAPDAPVGLFATWSLSGPVFDGFTVVA